MSIFISYRRGVTQDIVGRIKDRLQLSFDEDVFQDLGSIPIAADFVERTRQAVERATVVLVVIGPDWTRDGKLHSPSDFVRKEVEQALARKGVFLVPVLVNGAQMPDAAELPASMHDLLSRNAVRIDSVDFDHHMQRLEAAIAPYAQRKPTPSRRSSRGNSIPLWTGVAVVGIAVPAVIYATSSGVGGPDGAGDKRGDGAGGTTPTNAGGAIQTGTGGTIPSAAGATILIAAGGTKLSTGGAPGAGGKRPNTGGVPVPGTGGVPTCASTNLQCRQSATCVDTSNGPECRTTCKSSPESCNGRDDNCDGRIDEGINLSGCRNYGFDRDGDGYFASVACLCGPADGRSPAEPNRGTDPNDCVHATSTFQAGAMAACQGLPATASWDWNHDGHVEKEFPSLGSSTSRGFGRGCDVHAGWQGTVASCGTIATWITNCSEIAGNLNTSTEPRQQRCR